METNLIHDNIFEKQNIYCKITQIIDNIISSYDKALIYDIEVYPNYCLFIFLDLVNQQIYVFEKYENTDNLEDLRQLITKDSLLIGYNSNHYDNKILKYVLYKLNQGYEIKNQDIYDLSTFLVTQNLRERFEIEFRSNYNYSQKNRYWKESVDLIKFHSNKSLKELAVAYNHHKLQELPISPDKHLTIEEINLIKPYCLNDVEITFKVFQQLQEEFNLRMYLDKEYQEHKNKAGYTQSFISKSWPDIAQDLMGIIYACENSKKYNQIAQLRIPDYREIPLKNIIIPQIDFKTKYCMDLLEKIKQHTIKLKPKQIKVRKLNYTTYVVCKDNFNEQIEISTTKYSLGLGGIHSDNKNEIYTSSPNLAIVDLDVASFYPSLIIVNRIKPDFLNDNWLSIYERLKNERIIAKRKGDKIKSNSLKLVLNSIYGKFQSEYFYAYDPKTVFSITINGQLILLTLIETLELEGIRVFYANTDGITVLLNNDKTEIFRKIINEWQEKFKLELEETKYKRFVLDNVNNFFALKDNGEVKRKGVYSYES